MLEHVRRNSQRLCPAVGASSVAHSGKSGDQSSVDDNVRRRKFNLRTARPKATSVVSSTRSSLPSTARHIPVVRLRKDAATAAQPYPTMADLIGRAHGEEPAQLARRLGACTVLALGHDLGRGSQSRASHHRSRVRVALS